MCVSNSVCGCVFQYLWIIHCITDAIFSCTYIYVDMCMDLSIERVTYAANAPANIPTLAWECYMVMG